MIEEQRMPLESIGTLQERMGGDMHSGRRESNPANKIWLETTFLGVIVIFALFGLLLKKTDELHC